MLVLFTRAIMLFGLHGLVSAFAYLVRKLLRKDTGRTGVIAASSFVLCIASFVGFGVTSDAEKSRTPQAGLGAQNAVGGLGEAWAGSMGSVSPIVWMTDALQGQ